MAMQGEGHQTRSRLGIPSSEDLDTHASIRISLSSYCISSAILGTFHHSGCPVETSWRNPTAGRETSLKAVSPSPHSMKAVAMAKSKFIRDHLRSKAVWT